MGICGSGDSSVVDETSHVNKESEEVKSKVKVSTYEKPQEKSATSGTEMPIPSSSGVMDQRSSSIDENKENEDVVKVDEKSKLDDEKKSDSGDDIDGPTKPDVRKEENDVESEKKHDDNDEYEEVEGETDDEDPIEPSGSFLTKEDRELLHDLETKNRIVTFSEDYSDERIGQLLEEVGHHREEEEHLVGLDWARPLGLSGLSGLASLLSHPQPPPLHRISFRSGSESTEIFSEFGQLLERYATKLCIDILEFENFSDVQNTFWESLNHFVSKNEHLTRLAFRSCESLTADNFVELLLNSSKNEKNKLRTLIIENCGPLSFSSVEEKASSVEQHFGMFECLDIRKCPITSLNEFMRLVTLCCGKSLQTLSLVNCSIENDEEVKSLIDNITKMENFKSIHLGNIEDDVEYRNKITSKAVLDHFGPLNALGGKIKVNLERNAIGDAAFCFLHRKVWDCCRVEGMNLTNKSLVQVRRIIKTNQEFSVSLKDNRFSNGHKNELDPLFRIRELCYLSFENNKIGIYGAESMIPSFKHLDRSENDGEINLSSIHINDSVDDRFILSVLNVGWQVRLGGNGFTSDGVKKISNAIRRLKKLVSLDLSRTEFDSEMMNELTKMYVSVKQCHHNNGVVLTLDHCGLTDEIVIPFFRRISRMETLQVIRMRNNPRISIKAVKVLLRELKKKEGRFVFVVCSSLRNYQGQYLLPEQIDDEFVRLMKECGKKLEDFQFPTSFHKKLKVFMKKKVKKRKKKE